MLFCKICRKPIIATCNRIQKSELREFMGQEWTKTKPQLMHMYPTAKKQHNLCFYHQQTKGKKK